MLRSCFWDMLTNMGILSARKKKEEVKKVSEVHISGSKQQTAAKLLSNKSQNVRRWYL